MANRAIFLIPLLLLLCIPSVSALVYNQSGNTAYYTEDVTLISGSYRHDQNYMQDDMVMIIFAAGVLFWILSVFSPACYDIFAVLTPCWFAVATWFSAYMTRETMDTIVSGGEIFAVHHQIIDPQPYFQILCFLATAFSVLTCYYLLFMKDADRKVKQSTPMPSEK